MNASSPAHLAEGALVAAKAFTAGSELWVIENNPNLSLWHDIDFASCSLLTENNLHKKSEIPDELKQILEATKLETKLNLKLNDYVLLGSSNHFKNKWILLYPQTEPQKVAAEVEKLAGSLRFSSLRLFSDTKAISQLLKTRPTTSSLTISFIENT
jgi:hypothetical protein